MSDTLLNILPGLTDLASEKFGGKALEASDEFFAGKENLLKPDPPVFIPDKYTENGKWMDGWESRRKRIQGHDWCIIKLGVQGVIESLDIDTSHFLGNHPPYASVDACFSKGKKITEKDWKTILNSSPLDPGSHNIFPVSDKEVYDMVRLNIYPDGGVARFRVYGKLKPVLKTGKKNELIDLAAYINGGKVIICNDMFFGSKDNLINPGRSKVMGDGWETKRKRIPGYDWVIVKLASPGKVKKITVDTNLFKGNYPDQCSIDCCCEPDLSDKDAAGQKVKWMELLPKTPLKGHKENVFENELKESGKITHVRLNIFPDGGVSRLRVFGIPD